jgi:hypothetical protein
MADWPFGLLADTYMRQYMHVTNPRFGITVVSISCSCPILGVHKDLLFYTYTLYIHYYRYTSVD